MNVLVYLLHEIIFFINEHYQINQQQGLQLGRMINEIKNASWSI